MSRIVLAIDTSTPAVVTGVLCRHEDGRIETLARRVALGAHAHAELVTPNIVAAVKDSGLALGDLEAVVVGCGPGPFTGLRVGMATAGAYGHALGLPVHGVCSLDAVAVKIPGEVLVVTDARRREVYWARYRDGVRIAGPGVDAPGDVAGTGQVAGSPVHCALFDLPRVGPEHPWPDGLVAAVGDWHGEPAPPVPLYLRRPDARTLAERAGVSQ